MMAASGMRPARAFLTLCLICAATSRVSSARMAGLEAAEAWVTYRSKGLEAASTADDLSLSSVVALSSEQQPQYGPSFAELGVRATPETPERLHITVEPRGQQRWRVPDSIVRRPGAVRGLAASSLLYQVQQQGLAAAGQPFALTVTRKATGQPVLDTRGHRFLFKDQLIEFTTSVPADADLYGLGEATLPYGLVLPRNGTVFAMWARDSAAAEPMINTYGAHPFLLQLNKDGTAQGTVFLNSNGMDVVLNRTSVTYRAIGGLLELYVFLGPSPEQVIRQYHQVVGPPMMPPYWALGAQQGKWGYTTVEMLEQVVANYSAAGLPLEGLWVDIEVMANRFKVFTFDEERYNPQRMRAFVERLHAAGQHWAPIFNPGIATMPGYKAFEEGTNEGIWITDATGQPYRGQVWPGSVFFPSYLSNKTAGWLQRQMQHMYDQVAFDGMWLDMSEAANFCSGMVCELPLANKSAMAALELPTPADYNVTVIQKLRCTCQLDCTAAPQDDSIATPPYAIHNFGWKESLTNNGAKERARDGREAAPLDLKAISVTARHPDGTREYDAHNLYGTAMALQFNRAFRAVSGKRVFLLTRSTFPGAGVVTGHWTGDTSISWQALRESTASVLNANMWGLAMTGADICGYGIEGSDLRLSGAELEELCTRWVSAGAFHPLSRNHMNFFTPPHEPYRWPATTAAAKKAYGLRYRLLTYLYSSLFLAHRRGGTLARPLFFADPTDAAARSVSEQWMLGEALLVSPVVSNASASGTIRPYFTAGAWYSAWDHARLDSAGQQVAMDVPLGDIAVHLRGGAVLPLQRYAPVTRDVRFSPITLLVTLPAAPASGAGGGAGAASQPYALEPECAAAHARNAGQLVSCGLLYADDDAQDVTDATSVQAWLHATTEPDGRSGSVSSVVKAAAPQLQDKVRIAELRVLGLAGAHAQYDAANSGGGGGSSSLLASLMSASQRRGGARAARAATAAKPAHSTIAAESNRRASVVVVAGAGAGKQAAQASYDAATGVLKITGLDLPAAQPFTLAWQL